ncbi:MAG TPA: alpha/beta fold hydrolase [Anaerolineales bacterium]|nr:alpha/beta fold hydrolase [Anaerolineales bacterium]
MKTEIIRLEGWTLRARLPTDLAGAPALLMLHGWLGDEDVMWIFASKAPDGFALFSPQAPYQVPGGGFSWVRNRGSGLSKFTDFEPAVAALDGLIDALAGRFYGEFSKVHVMGFSQGAALAYCWAARSPGRIRSLAALAGFPPEGLEANLKGGDWNGLPVFIAHGTQDEVVPVSHMRAGARIAERAGAALNLCEDAVGHKLSANCHRALGHFYESLIANPG